MATTPWQNFLDKASSYMIYANNRPPGVEPSTEERQKLADMKDAYNALSGAEKIRYEWLGGPNFILRYIMATGGGRANWSA